MKKYIARELRTVSAEPMTRLEYNVLRGWSVPADEDPADSGFRVINSPTHMNWLPTEEFERTFKLVK